MQHLSRVIALGLGLSLTACAGNGPAGSETASAVADATPSVTTLFRCVLSTWVDVPSVTFGSIITSNTSYEGTEVLGLEPVVLNPNTDPTAMVYFHKKDGKTRAHLQIRVNGTVVSQESFQDVVGSGQVMDVYYNVGNTTFGELTCFKMRTF